MLRVICLILMASGLHCLDADWRIIGGETAAENYPYQASVWRSDSFSCGGAIITTKTILTGAQCVVSRDPEEVIVKVGTNKLSDQNGVEYQAAALVPHPQFSNQLITNDVGLVILDEAIAYNNRVQPIAIDTDVLQSGVDATLTGWGFVRYPDIFLSDNLKIMATKTITNADCQTRMSGFGGPIMDSSLCTFTKVGEGICYGDTGGPLVANGKVVGVSSWFAACAVGRPDVYARISSFATWINNNKV